MRYLLSILTILAIIGSVWYNKGLTSEHHAAIDKLNIKLEEIQTTTEPKIAKADKQLNELFTAVDLEKADYENKLAFIESRLGAAQKQQEGRLNALSCIVSFLPRNGRLRWKPSEHAGRK